MPVVNKTIFEIPDMHFIVDENGLIVEYGNDMGFVPMNEIPDFINWLRDEYNKFNDLSEYKRSTLEHKHTCSKCGLTFEGVTNYYCSDINCPTFTKVSF